MPASVGLEDKVCRSADVLEAEFEDEVVLLGVGDGAYYGLRATSHDIWRRIAEPVRVRDLCAALAETYAVPAEQLQPDTLRFLDRLASMKVIEVAS